MMTMMMNEIDLKDTNKRTRHAADAVGVGVVAHQAWSLAKQYGFWMDLWSPVWTIVHW